MELASRSKLAEQSDQPLNLWVEHVMPQSWGDDWPYEDGSTGRPSDDDGKAIARNAILHTLGNLTLLTGGLNISSGNKGFDEKKVKFAEHTGLFLNKWFTGKTRWTENEIRERGERFADLAVSRWVGLDGS
ncbi:HNH endonuclease family protein [Rhodophyticola porphyridii]|uniref:HNH endonuclease n=1 Tax=Rhodophyticola porphyridii TaxID=1852017 RepID=A0A3L9Y3E4_9RHOB|nr:HNH endonuclease family protein [Rhodophyticola porphyridii]RMA41828.1 HNH endonuclease [Rhodophyticola porphyridii]